MWIGTGFDFLPKPLDSDVFYSLGPVSPILSICERYWNTNFRFLIASLGAVIHKNIQPPPPSPCGPSAQAYSNTSIVIRFYLWVRVRLGAQLKFYVKLVHDKTNPSETEWAFQKVVFHHAAYLHPEVQQWLTKPVLSQAHNSKLDKQLLFWYVCVCLSHRVMMIAHTDCSFACTHGFFFNFTPIIHSSGFVCGTLGENKECLLFPVGFLVCEALCRSLLCKGSLNSIALLMLWLNVFFQKLFV